MRRERKTTQLFLSAEGLFARKKNNNTIFRLRKETVCGEIEKNGMRRNRFERGESAVTNNSLNQIVARMRLKSESRSWRRPWRLT